MQRATSTSTLVRQTSSIISTQSYAELEKDQENIANTLENTDNTAPIPYVYFNNLSAETILRMGLKKQSKRLNYNFHAYKLSRDKKQLPKLINTGRFFMIPETFSLSSPVQGTSFPKEKTVYPHPAAIDDEKPQTNEKLYLLFEDDNDLFYIQPDKKSLEKLLVEFYLKPISNKILRKVLYFSDCLTTTHEAQDKVFESFVTDPPASIEAFLERTVKALYEPDRVRIGTDFEAFDTQQIITQWNKIDPKEKELIEHEFNLKIKEIAFMRSKDHPGCLNILNNAMHEGSIEKAWLKKSDIDMMESKNAQNFATALAVFPDLSIYGTLSVLTTYAATHADEFSTEGMQTLNALKILLGALFTGYYLLRIYEVHRIHDYKKHYTNEIGHQNTSNLSTINKEAWLLFTQVVIVSLFAGYPLKSNPTSSSDSIIDPAMLAVSALSLAIAIPLVTAAYHRYAHDNKKMKPSHYASLALIGLVAGSLIYFIPSACELAGSTDDRLKGILEGSVLDRVVSAIAGIGFYYLGKSTSCATRSPVISSKSGSPSSSSNASKVNKVNSDSPKNNGGKGDK